MWIHDILQTALGFSPERAALIILFGILTAILWNKIKRLIADSEAVIVLLTSIETKLDLNAKKLHDHVEETAKKAASEHWMECQHMRCPKTDRLIIVNEEIVRTINSFVADGRISRERTQELLQRIEQSMSRQEQNLNVFVNEAGREILRTLRKAKDD